MKSLVEIFFAVASLAVIIMFLPEIIGIGVVIAAAFYLISFVTGISDALNR